MINKLQEKKTLFYSQVKPNTAQMEKIHFKELA